MTPNSSTLQVVIPSLGINGQISFDGNLTSASNLVGLSYVAVSPWAQSSSPTNPNNFLNYSEFVFGFETPQAAMPTSGTAVFSGPGTATAVRLQDGRHRNSSYDVRANSVSITANFGSGAVKAAFTQMLATTAS